MGKGYSLQVTQLLRDWSRGDQEALESLIPLVHNELHRLAHRFLRHERIDHTLQTTALVNEAYLRLIESDKVNWQSRAHFFAIMANLMRRILIDFARARDYRKREGKLIRQELLEECAMTLQPDVDFLLLDESLRRLAGFAPREARVVELRFFGGLSAKEIAEVLKVTSRTVRRDWTAAKAWLEREMKQAEEG